MKATFQFLTALLICIMVGVPAANAVGANPIAGVGVMVALSSILSFVTPAGALYDVALMQMWERELVNKLRYEGQWMSRIPSKDKYVNNNIINITEVGADPRVLINNNTYPIPFSQRKDDNIPVGLNKYDTENTEITRDELYALPYDKEGSVIRDHREVLEERTSEHGLHSLAPVENHAEAPVLVTTGPVRNGRKMLIYADLVTLKEKWDKLKIPKKDRLLVLCTEHVADLLLEDKELKNQYQNHKEGAIATNYCGFELYEDVYNPVYDTDNKKKAFDAAPEGTDRNASVAFYVKRTFKAKGTLEMFKSDAKNDPENRRTLVGFQLYMVVLPVTLKGIASIVSAPQ